MTPAPDDGDLRGKVTRMIITQQRNGFYVSVGSGARPGFGEMMCPDGDYVAADRDELAELVRRLVAEPQEGRVG